MTTPSIVETTTTLPQVETKEETNERLSNRHKAWVLVNKSDITLDEFRILTYKGKLYDLDPMKGEMGFMRMGGKGTYYISAVGYLAIANRNPNFDGMDAEVVYEGDLLTKKENGSIHIVYGDAHMAFHKDKLLGAYANVYRKDRSIVTSVLMSFRLCNKGANQWITNPNGMILKTAESNAIKRAFALDDIEESE